MSPSSSAVGFQPLSMKVPVEHQEVGLQLKKPGIDEQGQDEHWKVVLGAGEGGNSTVSKLGSTVLRVRPAEKGECWICCVRPWEPQRRESVGHAV